LVLQAGRAVEPPPSQRPRPTGTGLIVGQVVDGSSGKAIPETIVQLVFAGGGLLQTRVMTDGDGRFFFADLPAGAFFLSATKPGYTRRTAINTSPPTFELADGERRSDARLELWKNGVITGTVVDDIGEPVVGVTVRAMRRVVSAGRTRYLTTNPIGQATTDDRGVFRMSALVPDEYVVFVPSTQTSIPIALVQSTARSAALQNEMFRAINEFSPLGNARNQAFGDVVLMTPGSIAVPPAADAAGHLNVFQTTYYPATLNPSDATPIALASGEERSGINLQLKSVRSVRLAGRLIGPGGSLLPTALRLTPVGTGTWTSEVGLETVTGMSENGGAFTLLGVPAGQYLLRVLSPRPSDLGGGMLAPPSTADQPIHWAAQVVTVGDTDLTGVEVVLRPTVRVSGRLEFSGTKPPPASAGLARVRFQPVEAGSTWGGAVDPDASHNFVAGLPGGRYFVEVEAPADWYVKAVSDGRNEVLHSGVDVSGDVNLVVTLSDRTTELSGAVRDAKGAPDLRAVVVVFPVDWRARADLGSRHRRFTSAPITRAGAYRIVDLFPDAYCVAALPVDAIFAWQDAKMLEALSRTATRVQLGEGEQRVVDLKTGQGR
jgi:hypothetical protein